MEDKYLHNISQLIEDKSFFYGENVRTLIDTITRVQSNINLDENKVFGKHIHAFIWAFFTGVYYGKKIENIDWVKKDGFTFGTIYRDQASTAADAMLTIAIGEINTDDFETTFTSNMGTRELLNIISYYAEGGAKYILEIRESDETRNFLDAPYHYFDEINARLKNK